MADFVNYHKREVTLPGGLKDLTELFDPPRPVPSTRVQKEIQRVRPKRPSFEIDRDESGAISVHEIGPKVRAVYEAKAPISSLSLDAPEPQAFHLSLLHTRVEPVKALLGVLTIGRASKERADAVKGIFTEHGLNPQASENFSLCKPEAPPEILFSIGPIPEDPEAFVKLAVALFHELVSKSDVPLLSYTYKELCMKE